MAKDPAFLFYSSDFISGVSDLTMEERGQYITLLCLQHQKGHLSDKLIKLSVGNATADVLHKFSIDENGLYYSNRLDIEIVKRREHSEKQRQRAIDGWEKRKATADATALPLENENTNIVINNIEERKQKFVESLQPYLKTYGPDMLNDFYGYWTEHGEKDKKFKAEKQTSFSIERRLETWKKNDNKFNPKQKQDRL